MSNKLKTREQQRWLFKNKDTDNRTCFYCAKSGHTIKECGDKKRNRKPCQRYIDSGIKRFGPDYEWDRNKLKQRNLKKPVQLVISDDNEQNQDPISVIMATQAPIQAKQEKSSTNYPRTVAMISVDLKNHEGDWYNNMTTLIDSCGCENGINSNFAQMHGFQIQTDTDKGPSAISACGGVIDFKEYVVVQIKIKDAYIWEKFYLMENLPRNLLLGFPWFKKNEAILDAGKGYLNVTHLNQIVPLIRLKKLQPEETVFATFGLQNSNLLLFQHPTSISNQLEKAFNLANPYKEILHTQTDISANATKIQNVFAATLPRRRINPIENDIIKLQQQHYEDKQKDSVYQQQLQNLVAEYEDIFDTESTEPARVPEIHIDLKPEFANKRFFRPEPLRSIKEQTIIDDNATKLIKQEKARLNPTSIHNLGQVIVPRFDKDGNELVDRARVCIDARPINKGLTPYRYPIPSIKKILTEMSKKKFFSEIDLSDSFQQLPISNELSDLLTVTTSFGKVSCTRLTYGVQFATDVFQETMTLEFMEFLENWLMIYVDNMQLKTDTKEEHLVALQQLFLRMRKLNIKCRKEKCIFMVDSIRTMGFVVQHGVIKPDPQKLDMLKKMPEPSTKQQLKAYLGLLQFYRDMLPHLAHTAFQLYAATSENYVFQWTDKLSKYFNLTKTMLEKEILNTNLQGEKDIKVYVDASKSAVCAVIVQRQKIVACTSKVLNPSQRRWSTVERELYAISWGFKKLRFYLHGVFFEVFTDHKPLLGLVNKDLEPPNNRIATMLLSISEYTFQLQYLPGSRNIIADFGTRHLDISEWDKITEDDREGLHELFHCSFEETQERTSDLEQFLSSDYITEKDQLEIQKTKLDVHKGELFFSVVIKGQNKTWVPYQNRRALFWHLHQHLHPGSVKMHELFQQSQLFWPFMSKDVEKYLSQCTCTTKKTKAPHKYSEKIKIVAQHPLHILAIDLYSFGEHLYFTAVCIFTRFSWVKEIPDKQATTVLDAYLEYCQIFAEPELISCDNGSEFNLIETEKTNHPSEHPAANGVIERFHQELGKMARIFDLPPDKILALVACS